MCAVLVEMVIRSGMDVSSWLLVLTVASHTLAVDLPTAGGGTVPRRAALPAVVLKMLVLGAPDTSPTEVASAFSGMR